MFLFISKHIGRYIIPLKPTINAFILFKVNIVFVLKEVRPEMELFLDNHLRCVKSLNAISKYNPNAHLTIYLIL